ncbi:hypothetical protein I3843_03G091800 [Carya illinoinensis]|uniref:Uncharacterized protein n=1 Tax=Carya illinoinensis TaxID=32201 RepID=A0A8T1QYV7_CARIL|nr:uncharacterized protein LOC122305545 [Carya illinoinensis]KAG2715687.1 hypothetical protein I3760_03G089700 [Carya illinoinensis]KAG6660310.1 hypothetical protein CIPAW_03G096800 [Carya illinoinensis]KAG6721032.1 hypothetical protein I3842_03G092200 [Carya illinoinensis]KAG7986646.1 hypothetical protein I3843_03G091800 [Carya illinoinensis]
MFDSVLELISQAASNSVFIFCFCHLIIVVILVGSKSSPNLDKEEEIPVSGIINTSTYQKQGRKSEQLFDGKELSYSQEAAPAADKEEKGNSDDHDNKDADKDGEDHHDELRRRVEEFIEKVNQGWKEELLGKRECGMGACNTCNVNLRTR